MRIGWNTGAIAFVFSERPIRRANFVAPTFRCLADFQIAIIVPVGSH